MTTGKTDGFTLAGWLIAGGILLELLVGSAYVFCTRPQPPDEVTIISPELPVSLSPAQATGDPSCNRR